MPAYRGRGELKLDTVSVGVSSDITLSVEVEEWRREAWDSVLPGGLEALSLVGTRALIEVVLNDYTHPNLAKMILGSGAGPVAGLVGTGIEYALEFSGINAADNCSTLTLSAPRFVTISADSIPLISDGYAAPKLRGEILRLPGDATEWFSLQLA